METLVFEGELLALTSIAHNGGQAFGIESKLRRERFVQPDGTVEEVPLLSGNGLRGMLRDRGMWHMCRALGYGVDEEAGKVRGLSLSAFYFLFSGGSLGEGGGDGIDIDYARRLRETIPLTSIFGGAVGNQILPGKAKVGKALPVCAETAHLIPARYIYKSSAKVRRAFKEMLDDDISALGFAPQDAYADLHSYLLFSTPKANPKLRAWADRKFGDEYERQDWFQTLVQKNLPSIWDYLQTEMYTRKDDERNEKLRTVIAGSSLKQLEDKGNLSLLPEEALEQRQEKAERKPQQMMYYCIVGETPVMLADGRRLNAREVYLEMLEGKQTEVLAYDFKRKEFTPARIQDVKTWDVEQTISIKTSHGYQLTGTLDHKMLTWGEQGLEWKSLDKLKVGDRIAASAQLPIDETDLSLNPVVTHLSECALVSEELAAKLCAYLPAALVYRSSDLKRARPVRGEPASHPFAIRMTALRTLLADGVIDLDYCRQHLHAILPASRSNASIKPQWELTPEHISVLGLYLSDGSMSKDERRFHFASISPEQRNEFSELMSHLFGVNPTTETAIGVGYSRPLICRFFKEVFGASGGRKSRRVRIPSLIFGLPQEYQRAFVAAYQAGDGSVYQMAGRGCEYGERNVIHTSSRELAIDFVYLLTGLGYTPTIAESAERQATFGAIAMCRVEWSEVSPLKQYLPAGIGREVGDYRRDHQITKQSLASLAGIHPATLRAFESGQYAPSRYTAEAISKATGLPCEVIGLPLTWMRVNELKLNEETQTIYAFDVEKHHNFVCGTGALVSHNCETFAAGTPFYWKLTLEDVNNVEYEAFMTTLAEFSKMPYVGGKSAVGLGEVAVRFDKWMTIDSRVQVGTTEISRPVGTAYSEHLKTRGDEIRKALETL